MAYEPRGGRGDHRDRGDRDGQDQDGFVKVRGRSKCLLLSWCIFASVNHSYRPITPPAQ
jgi:hypothetical protein